MAAAVLGGIVALSSTQVLAAGVTATNPPAAKNPTLVLAASCNPCNPCAAKKCNPCNPCAAKACNPCNPCAAKKACNPCNPCAAKAC
ncbi:MAG: YHS domain-containing protein, partial [Gammaproteobacteria bacterium]|nr:YHS domain-containing protein [Gammaproteobacteria bacterium]NIM72145.1 YHS domain-containing protein [Gammaproteobacteria bacterium]NIN38754.1 YHS domain-containing protein [Gammaproteobacteria bacterium]NIO23892.1 YHS domain-containing protein [Gammaproteobacteria bacterium]NIO64530.1 YHS domain-containing protein [Gammaproteobacteria bacterium]